MFPVVELTTNLRLCFTLSTREKALEGAFSMIVKTAPKVFKTLVSRRSCPGGRAAALQLGPRARRGGAAPPTARPGAAAAAGTSQPPSRRAASVTGTYRTYLSVFTESAFSKFTVFANAFG